MKTITSFARDKRGVGLIFALVSVVLLSMIMTVFYEIVIPRARNVKGIEQSNVAAYNAESGIEASLNSFTGADIISNINSTNVGYNSSGVLNYTCNSGSCTFPEPGKGNSPTSENYNIIRPGSPIQIPIANGTIGSNFRIVFHMPSFSGGTSGDQLKDYQTEPYFIWTFTTPTKSITSSQGEMINLFDNNSKKAFEIYTNTTSSGISNSGTLDKLWTFINANQVDCTNNYKCTLKISLIKDLETNTGRKIPYLEYQITADNLILPLQYAILTSTGTQGPFSKTVTREVERFTTNEAFDFTVLQ